LKNIESPHPLTTLALGEASRKKRMSLKQLFRDKREKRQLKSELIQEKDWAALRPVCRGYNMWFFGGGMCDPCPTGSSGQRGGGDETDSALRGGKKNHLEGGIFRGC